MRSQTRRLALPNRIRYPTDCLFASSCSPPHFAMTQLLSATALWLTPTVTSTLLINCPRGRTTPAIPAGVTPTINANIAILSKGGEQIQFINIRQMETRKLTFCLSAVAYSETENYKHPKSLD